MDSVFTQLDREWIALARRPTTAGRRRARQRLHVGWRLECGAAREHNASRCTVGFRPRHGAPCGRARDGCEIVARTLLQLLLPRTCRLAALVGSRLG